MNLPASSGVVMKASKPCWLNFSRHLLRLSAARSAPLMRATTSRGVPAGASSASHWVNWKSFTPASLHGRHVGQERGARRVGDARAPAACRP